MQQLCPGCVRARHNTTTLPVLPRRLPKHGEVSQQKTATKTQNKTRSSSQSSVPRFMPSNARFGLGSELLQPPNTSQPDPRMGLWGEKLFGGRESLETPTCCWGLGGARGWPCSSRDVMDGALPRRGGEAEGKAGSCPSVTQSTSLALGEEAENAAWWERPENQFTA